jgi:RNA polymerase sigma-70 factor (ECF subfamily)
MVRALQSRGQDPVAADVPVRIYERLRNRWASSGLLRAQGTEHRVLFFVLDATNRPGATVDLGMGSFSALLAGGDGVRSSPSEAATEFASAAERYLPDLRRFAVTLVPSGEAEDLIQDTLVRAWQKRELFDADRGTYRSWLFAIMADRARQRWRRRTVLRLTDRDESTPDAEVNSVSRVDVRRAVESLPLRQRNAIILRFYLDLNVDEVAKVLHCPAGTAKSLLYRARLSLQQYLEADYE